MALKLLPDPSVQWGVVPLILPPLACASCQRIFLPENAHIRGWKPPPQLPPTSQSRARASSQPSFWEAPAAPMTLAQCHTEAGVRGKGGSQLVRAPGASGRASFGPWHILGQCSARWPLTCAILWPLGDDWWGAWDSPGIVHCTHNKQQNHGLLETTA